MCLEYLSTPVMWNRSMPSALQLAPSASLLFILRLDHGDLLNLEKGHINELLRDSFQHEFLQDHLHQFTNMFQELWCQNVYDLLHDAFLRAGTHPAPIVYLAFALGVPCSSLHLSLCPCLCPSLDSLSDSVSHQPTAAAPYASLDFVLPVFVVLLVAARFVDIRRFWRVGSVFLVGRV